MKTVTKATYVTLKCPVCKTPVDVNVKVTAQHRGTGLKSEHTYALASLPSEHTCNEETK